MNWTSFFLGFAAMFAINVLASLVLFVIFIARPLIKDNPADRSNV